MGSENNLVDCGSILETEVGVSTGLHEYQEHTCVD